MKLKDLFLLGAGIIGGFSGVAINNANAQNMPSFDCKKAKTSVEKQICASASLSRKDRLLNQLYQNAKISVLGKGQSNQIGEQLSWLKNRDTCTQRTKDDNFEKCLINAYDARINDLAVATLFKNPDLSFSAIQQTAPQQVNHYRALYLYVTKPKSTARDNEIIGYMQPAFNKMAAENSYVKGTLEDAGVKTLNDAVKNDDNFGAAWSLSSYGLENQVTMPCAALVQKPKLISGIDAYFGSSLDGFMPHSDCSLNLPHLKAFDKLLTDANKNAPECDGTIRFAIWKSQAKREDAMRLGNIAEALEYSNPNDPPSNFIKTNKKTYDAAQAELFTYYNQYFASKNISQAKIKQALQYHINDIADGDGC